MQLHQLGPHPSTVALPSPLSPMQQVQQWARQQLHQLAQRRNPTKRRLPLSMNPFPVLPSKGPLVTVSYRSQNRSQTKQLDQLGGTHPYSPPL